MNVDDIDLSLAHDPDAVRAALKRQTDRLNMITWLRQAAADRHGGAHWYVVQVGGCTANHLADSLRAASIEAWCPMETKMRRNRRSHQKEKIQVPVFPGFLLVRVPAFEAAWLGVLSFDGAVSILGNGTLPVALPDKTVNDLKAILDPNAVRYIFSPGDRVLIEAGAFGAIEATVIDRENYRTGKVVLDVEAFGRMTRCTMDIDDLKKLG